MFAASVASSATSRALLVRSTRRHWPLRRLPRAEPRLALFNPKSGNRNFNIQNSSHSAFSTISFDDNVFDSNTSSPSPGSVHSQQSSLKQSFIQNQTITPQLSPSGQQLHQQIQQWISTNPRIAPYKAEESLAKLWVEQQELFHQWEQQQKIKQTLPTILLTTESVNLVIQAWCHSNNGEVAAKRAERLLNWMEDLHSSDSIRHAWSSFLPKPNYQSYATAIDAWSRAAVYESAHPNSPFSNEAGTKSGGRTKNNVISLATKAGFECAKRAEGLLMHMQRTIQLHAPPLHHCHLQWGCIRTLPRRILSSYAIRSFHRSLLRAKTNSRSRHHRPFLSSLCLSQRNLSRRRLLTLDCQRRRPRRLQACLQAWRKSPGLLHQGSLPQLRS